MSAVFLGEVVEARWYLERNLLPRSVQPIDFDCTATATEGESMEEGVAEWASHEEERMSRRLFIFSLAIARS